MAKKDQEGDRLTAEAQALKEEEDRLAAEAQALKDEEDCLALEHDEERLAAVEFAKSVWVLNLTISVSILTIMHIL